MKKNKKIIFLIFVFTICFLLGGCGEKTVQTLKYNLDEIEDNIYATYYNTHSRAPAYNYDVITLNCEGQIKTFQGNVHISYVDVKPYVEVRISNYIYCDDIYVYIPSKTVKYMTDVGIR